MIHRISYKVHQRVGNVLDNIFIHFRVLTDHFQFNILAQLSGHVENNSSHLLEYVGQRHHAHRHDNLLQLSGNLGKLSGSLLEIGKLQSRHFQIRILQNNRFRNYQLTDQIHQRIHLFHIYADDALLFRLIFGKRLTLAGFLGLNHIVARLGPFLLRTLVVRL